MNWVKENKFVTGFIVVMLIGIGILGFEVMGASSAYDEASEKYTTASTEYSRLRHLVPYPSKQNLQAYEGQKEEAAKVITSFEADLSKKTFPFEPMSPEGFQDKLKSSVTAVRAKAGENGIKLPDKFYLSFDRYETTPPNPEAAGPLGREVKAIEWVVNQFISHPSTTVQSLVSLNRTDLPEEKGTGGKAGKGGGPGKGGPGGPGGGSGRRDLVKYHPFEISVLCKPDALRDVLKTVTGPQAPQFYVLRQIRIRNEKLKGPSRLADPTKPTDKVAAIEYIVGEEWIEAALRFEVVDFVNPGEKVASAPSAPAAKSSPR